MGERKSTSGALASLGVAIELWLREAEEQEMRGRHPQPYESNMPCSLSIPGLLRDAAAVSVRPQESSFEVGGCHKPKLAGFHMAIL